MIFWVLTRTVYFSDAFYNYSFVQMVFLSELPCTFAYITIGVAIYNVINLCQMIENKEILKAKNKRNRIIYVTVFFLCVLTQWIEVVLTVMKHNSDAFM